MTAFEFVFALISIITSLALTHIITGVIAMIRHRKKGSFSLTHALWIWVAFAVVLGNWGALWGSRGDLEWPAVRVLAWLTAMTSLYAFSALVIPEVERGEPLDLGEFHEREGRRYMIAHNLFAALSIVLILLVRGLTDVAAYDLMPPITAFFLGILAIRTRGRTQLAVSVLIALLALMFMVSNIGILTG